MQIVFQLFARKVENILISDILLRNSLGTSTDKRT